MLPSLMMEIFMEIIYCIFKEGCNAKKRKRTDSIVRFLFLSIFREFIFPLHHNHNNYIHQYFLAAPKYTGDKGLM